MNRDRGLLREHARAIFQAAVEAVHPGRAIKSRLAWNGEVLRIDDLSLALEPSDRIWVVGAGKAGGSMAVAVEEIFGGRIQAGTVVVPHGQSVPTRTIRVINAAHPFPDHHGLAGARAVQNLLAQTRSGDLVLCLLSGGASSLLPAPADGICLEDKIAVSRALMEAGADIVDLNTVRKHLSALKGGGLARLAAPARVLTLILSDVVDDRLDTIASGPTVGDPSSFQDALEIVTRLLPADRIPPAVLERLRSGGGGEIPETLKPRDPFLAGVHNLIIGNVRMALEGGRQTAKCLGYRSRILSSRITGEAREIGESYADLAGRLRKSPRLQLPRCLLAGGETTVTVHGSGRGGRNQELVLAAAAGLEGLEGILIGAMGSDGIDGPTDAAGAFADGRSVVRGRNSGLNLHEYLTRNDSYAYFKRLNDLLVTGPTGTNVMDLHLILLA